MNIMNTVPKVPNCGLHPACPPPAHSHWDCGFSPQLQRPSAYGPQRPMGRATWLRCSGHWGFDISFSGSWRGCELPPHPVRAVLPGPLENREPSKSMPCSWLGIIFSGENKWGPTLEISWDGGWWRGTSKKLRHHEKKPAKNMGRRMKQYVPHLCTLYLQSFLKIIPLFPAPKPKKLFLRPKNNVRPRFCQKMDGICDSFTIPSKKNKRGLNPRVNHPQ